MDAPRSGTAQSAMLNLLRGISAVFVAAGHARLMLIANAGDLDKPSALQKVFYFLTSLGPSSVLVFFVLSGFLVGSSIIKDITAGTWSWRSYIIARASRIYVVLLPALVIGVATDAIGLSYLSDASIYATPRYGGMLPDSILNNIQWTIILGNLLCLQEIFVEAAGSNIPLWSLTNEVWYYLIFPCFAVCLQSSLQTWKRVAYFLLGIIALAFLPIEISKLFAVWLMGVSIALLPRIRLPRFSASAVSAASMLFLMAQSAKLLGWFGDWFATGAMAAAFIYCWLSSPMGEFRPALVRVASAISAISYTFYLVHMPFIVFLTALVMRSGPKYLPDVNGVALVCAFVVACLAYASVIWYLFERNTPYVRRALAELFDAKPGTPSPWQAEHPPVL
jgi:peptidoglycan/LPS O-acetylase OafA/YrhL